MRNVSNRSLKHAPQALPTKDDKPIPCLLPAPNGMNHRRSLAVGVLVAVLVLRSKRHEGGSVPGHFDFDGYKEGEPTLCSVFDKAKWH